MSAQIEIVPQELLDLVTFSITDAAIADMRSKCLALRVLGPDDEEGYARCGEFLKLVISADKEVEDRRVELKAESLAFGRHIDSKAKPFRGALGEMKLYLREQRAIVDNEKKRREEAALKAAKERLDARIAALQAVKAEFTFDEVAAMNDEGFSVFLGYWQNEFAVDQKREAAEKARLEELENERAAQNALLAAERERVRQLEAEASKMRQEAFERETAELRKQQAEAAAIAATVKADREAAEAKASAEKLATERAEIEAAAKIANAVMFEEIRTNYPTVEAAWVEIARLRTLLGELATDMGRVLDGPVFNPLGNGGTHPAVRD